jgi:NAD(P)-dependent dehydrogenase (short-subunit alcohol dehydrogenase family)
MLIFIGIRTMSKLNPQSTSPLAPIGVTAAMKAASDASFIPKAKIFQEFALTDRVGLVSGGNRGLGLEMALALCEAGARAVYCFDLPVTPSEEWQATQKYVEGMGNNSRLEYVCLDVTDQEKVWAEGEKIGNKEGRMDFSIAAAGILRAHTDCLEYPAKQMREASDTQAHLIWSVTRFPRCTT